MFIPAIQWPLVKATFIEDVLGGLLFHPLFNIHWCDLWLGWYVNRIYGYNCPLASEYGIKNMPHSKSSTEDEDLYDQIIFLCLMEINSKDYLYDLSKEEFIDIGKKLSPDIEEIYNNNKFRFSLKKELLDKKTKEKDLDTSIIIASTRKNTDCYIEKMIDIVTSYDISSYEILIKSTKNIYSGKNVINVGGPDYGAAWGFNLCYKHSKGKAIVEMTDCSIPESSIFDFVNSNYLIRSSKDLNN